MKLWTVMPKTVYEATIVADSIYVCDSAKSEMIQDDRKFQNAYDWLVEQMKKNIGLPADPNIKYPVWAWYRLCGKQQRPDLRWLEFTGYTEPMVLIELCKENNEVLLTDENRWTHGPLNNWPCWSLDDKVWKAEQEWYDNADVSVEEKETRKHQTWNRIFDIAQSEHVQATFWELRQEDIRKVWMFNSNSKS